MKTLYQRFLWTTVGIMVFSMLIGFFITNAYYHVAVKEQNDAKNTEMARTIVAYIEETPDVDLDAYLDKIGKISYQMYVVDDTGDSTFYGGEFRDKTLSPSIEQRVLGGDVYHGMRDFPNQSFMTGFFANELSNTVGVPFSHNGTDYALFLRPNISLLFSEVHTILAGLFISIAVISLLAMLFVAKQLIHPLVALKDAMQRVGRNRFDVTLDIRRKDEIGQLAESFQQMTAELERSDTSRREFISNVSHDFQSPLQKIKGYAELMKQPELESDERLAYGTIIEQEAKRLSELTKKLLLISSLSQQSELRAKTPFALDEQIKQVLSGYRWRIEELELDVTYALDPVTYIGDPDLLESVWDNLLSNALKYNVAGGSIDLSLSDTDREVIFMIRDTGIGITPDDATRIFDRFYRADASRTTEGTGLGLSIVKDIVTLHGGTVQVDSQAGTTFTVTLPKL
ncbi:sensor histidine kinase [Exiguobacterium chiriqhucha]|uniref:sensor histidine kinase n=1 Tax=Exiguobacterium chiriqhucha TaxID=1385984 RepID=UPI0038B7FE24